MLEISDINRTLRAVVAPLVLGGPILAAKYLVLPMAGPEVVGVAGAVASAGISRLVHPRPLRFGAALATGGLVVSAAVLARGGNRHDAVPEPPGQVQQTAQSSSGGPVEPPTKAPSPTSTPPVTSAPPDTSTPPPGHSAHGP
jgi:hypothetical protein